MSFSIGWDDLRGEHVAFRGGGLAGRCVLSVVAWFEVVGVITFVGHTAELRPSPKQCGTPMCREAGTSVIEGLAEGSISNLPIPPMTHTGHNTTSGVAAAEGPVP